MSEYSGNIRDLPVVTGGHFIENSTKKIVFGPDGRFWNDYVMRLFTLEPEAESSVHSHPWPHWFLCIQGEGYFLIDKERVPLEFGTWVHVPGGVRHNFGNTGKGQLMALCIVPPEGDLKKLQDWAKARGMLFIVDEIQSGMGRTGNLFRYQQEGLEPDILLTGKALGNGMHIAAVLSRTPLATEDLHGFAGGSGDDAVACAAACEVFRQLDRGLLAHVQSVSRTLQEGLTALEANEHVLTCRSCGLAAAIVLRNAPTCERVHHALTQRGFLPGRQENVLFLKPPYVVTNEQILAFLAALRQELST